MSKKKVVSVESDDSSVVVDVSSVDAATTTTTDVVVDGVPSVDLPVDGVKKRSSSARKSKKSVSDVAMQSQLEELEKSLLSARESLVSASAENERLCDELDVAVRENKSLCKEFQRLKQDYKKLQGDNRANAALVEELHNELLRGKTQNDELMATIGRLQENVKGYSNELSVKEDEIARLESELESSLAQVDMVLECGFWRRMLYALGIKKVK